MYLYYASGGIIAGLIHNHYCASVHLFKVESFRLKLYFSWGMILSTDYVMPTVGNARAPTVGGCETACIRGEYTENR